MTLIQTYKKNWESMKNRTPKEKLEYLLEYYKWYAIGILLFVAFITHFIYSNITAKDCALNGIFINAHPSEDSLHKLTEEIASELTIDTSKYKISFNTNLSYFTDNENDYNNYETLQSLQVWYAAGEIDFLVGNHKFMTTMAYQGFFTDLSEVLTKEQYDFYKPYMHYIDADILNSDEIMGEIVLPNSTDPSNMKQPIPVFIELPTNEKISNIYAYETETTFFGIMPNAPHMDYALYTLDYLTK